MPRARAGPARTGRNRAVFACAAVLLGCRAVTPALRVSPIEERHAAVPVSAWRGGDEIVYRLSITGRGRTENWRVGVRLLDPLPGETLLSVPLRVERGEQQGWLESALLPVHVHATSEAEGARRRQARSEVPEAFLRSGLAQACAEEAVRDPATPRAGEGVHTWGRARAALDGLALAVSRNAALVDLLARAVDLPSPLVLLLHDGPLLRFVLPPQAPEPVHTSPATNRLWRVQATLLVADAPALEIDLVVANLPAALHSPLALGAGILSLHARSLREPARTIDLELADARRGTGSAWILPAAADLAGEERER